MKTFDEALIAVSNDPDKFHANAIQTRDERMANEIWKGVIYGMSAIWATKLAEALESRNPLERIMTSACSTLHIAFEFGLLVGMEMEKPE